MCNTRNKVSALVGDSTENTLAFIRDQLVIEVAGGNLFWINIAVYYLMHSPTLFSLCPVCLPSTRHTKWSSEFGSSSPRSYEAVLFRLQHHCMDYGMRVLQHSSQSQASFLPLRSCSLITIWLKMSLWDAGSMSGMKRYEAWPTPDIQSCMHLSYF